MGLTDWISDCSLLFISAFVSPFLSLCSVGQTAGFYCVRVVCCLSDVECDVTVVR